MIPKDENIHVILELANLGKFPDSLILLESLQNVSENDFLFLLESSFLKTLFDHFINLHNKGVFAKPNEELTHLALRSLMIVNHVLDTPLKQIGRILIKYNFKDFVCLLASVKNTSEKAFQVLSNAAVSIPEIFSKPVILKLQRCLIENCANPAKRLEYFLRIFFNLRDHSYIQPIDAYFYVNFLRLQYSASQKQRMTRDSILMIIQTLTHLMEADEIEDQTVTMIFSFVQECFFSRICMEYHIMTTINSVQKSDEQIQLEMLQLLYKFRSFDHIPLTEFVAKQVDDLKQVLTYKKRDQAISIILKLFTLTAQVKEQIAIDFIHALLKWERFQKTFEILAYSSHQKLKPNKRIIEKVFDLFNAMLEQESDFIIDFFLNEFLIGELVDISTFLDKKRRNKSIEMIIKVLNYINRQPKDKFISEEEMFEQMEDDSSQEIEDIIYKKITMSSIIDLFEVISLPYDKIGEIPPLFYKMQTLSLRIKQKLKNLFGSKFPSTLVSSIPGKEKNESVEDDWEDLDENEQPIQANSTTNEQFDALKNIINTFYQ